MNKIIFDIDLNLILEDLNKHKYNKKELFLSCLNDRLNKSLQSYYSEIMNSYNYIKYKDNLKVAKNLNRYDDICR